MKLARQLLKWFAARPAPRAPAVAPAPLMLALEPRIVYEASVAAVPVVHHHAEASHHHANYEAQKTQSPTVPGEGATPTGNAANAPAQRASEVNHKTQLTSGAQQGSQPEKEVVFVDTNVTNYQELLTGLPANVKVVLLDPNSNGLEQIAQYVKQHPGIDAINLISHGAEGQVQVGNVLLDQGDIAQYSAVLAQIGAAMKPNGDFLIYGCDVAAGNDGASLVHEISSLSGLNVAASTNLVGSAALGGSWTLNYDVGDVHTAVVLSSTAEQGYDYVLSQTTEDYTSAAATSLLTADITSFTLDGITYTYNIANSTTTAPDSSLQSLADENGSDYSLQVNQDGVVGLSSVTITMGDGKPFKMSSLDIDAQADANILIEANGSTTNDISYTSNGLYVTQTVNLTTNSAFDSVNSLTITGSNLLINLGHLVYQEITPPTLTTTGGATTFTSADSRSGTPVTVDGGLTVADTESTTITSASVSITGGFHSGQDVLGFTNQNGISGSYNAGTGVLSLSGSATIAQYQTALESVTFLDTSATPNTSARTISFSVDDGLASSTAGTKTVDVNSPPFVTTSGGITLYYRGAAAGAVDGGVSVSDPSQATQSSGTVSIGAGFQSGDTLAFTNNSATNFGNITAVYNSGTGVLTLSSAGASATDAQWAHAFDAVTFASTSTTYGNRTMSFVVNDGSTNSVAATKTVDELNPNPVVTTDSGSAAFVAGDNVTSTPVSVDSGLTLSDPSSTTLASATVAIAGNFVSGEDVLSFTNNGSTMGNVAVSSYNAATGVLTLTSAGATATVAQWQAALDAVKYTDTAITPNNATRTISFTVSDTTNTSNTGTRTVTVADTDQTPIVTTTGGTTNYLGGAAATAVDGGVTVSDLDNTTQSSGTVSISGGFHSGDTLAFTNNSATNFGNITAVYNSATGVLTLSSSGASATDAQWANAFDAVTFSSSASVTPGNRTISFVVNDGTKNSLAATKAVAVVAPPNVTTDSGSAAFTAGDNVASTPVAIDSGLTVTDASSGTLASATVAIAGNFHSGEDVLSFTNNGSTMGNIAVSSYNAATGVLTLTSAGATATVAQWQAALDAVKYTDTAVTPNNATRTISFTVSDTTNTSNTATRTATVADTDQTPIVTTTAGTTNYLGGAAATAVDGGVTVSDLDNPTQSSGTVSITGGFHSGDTLSFTNTSNTQFGNISASYNSGTGVLTLSSSGASATDAQWANAFAAVTFASTSTTYGNRTVSFVVNDGTKNSAAETKTVDVTNPDPVVTTDSGSAAFTAGDNTASTPVAVDSGLTLTDPATSTIASATVSITGNFVSGEDRLSFTNTSNTTFGNIAASYNSGAGVLTLTSSGNSATLSQWQNALEAVKYTDTAITPNNLTRTISFSVTDGNSNTSSAATRSVTVADVDQTPIVNTTGGTTNYVGGTGAGMIDVNVTVTDLDNTTMSSGTVSITSGFHSGDTLSFTNTSSPQFGNIQASYNSATGVLTLTSAGATSSKLQWADAFSAITFSASASATPGNRTISFVVNDGIENSAAATDTVDVLGPPTITTDSGSASFVAGDNATSTPVTVDSGLILSDGTASTLASATVAITGNFVSGEDVLSFTNNGSTMGNIAESSYNAATGVLTLTSAGATATVAQWQAALDAVTYTDTAVTPNNATRTIGFTVSDTTNTSNTATRTVTVFDVDQTPILTTTGGTTNYIGGTSAVAIDGGVTVSDLDNTTQASGTVSITSGFHSGDTLSFTNTSSSQFGNIQASYDSATGVLTLTSSGATSSDAQWAHAFSAITFSAGASATPGNRTIAFVVNDGIENSVAVTHTVDVLGPPTITADSGSATFVAGDNVTSTPIAVDSGLSLSDGSASTFASATVAITGNFHSGEDVLAFTNTNSTTFGNITASYSAGTGVLTLTSSGASATTAQWRAAFDAVTYTDTAITPNNATRTISFTATDSGSTTSNTATRTVTVADTDQTPIVTTTSGNTYSVPGASGATVDGGVTVSDLDNTTQASGTVSITSDFHSGDTLTFTNTNSTTFGNIVASYNATTGVLTLTSAGQTATDAQWANAFDAVTFSSASGASLGSRTISIVVNDGTENSTAATKTVDVVAQPVVTTTGATSFAAGDNVTSTPVAVDSGVTVTDLSSPTLASATVAITGNFQSGEDLLSFTNEGSAMGNIAGAYNASTGVLTLTSSGATATLAQWQAALDSILYTDTAITPNNTARTISFTVNDGTESSALVTKTISVADTDQTPIEIGGGGAVTYIEGGNGSSPVTLDPGVTLSDRGNATITTATVSISGGFLPGQDVLSFTGSAATGSISGSFNATTGVLTLTANGSAATLAQWDAALDSIAFSESGGSGAATRAISFAEGGQRSAGTRTISFTVSDGIKTSKPISMTVDVDVVTTQQTLGDEGRTPPAPALPPAMTQSPPPDTPLDPDSNLPSVLIELDHPPALGGTPIVQTITFTDPNAGHAPFSLDHTSVTSAESQDSSLSLFTTFAPQSVVMDYDVSPNHAFVMNLSNLLPTADGMRLNAMSDVTVRLADGRPLPTWLHYDAANGTLAGALPAGAHDVRVVVQQRDAAGNVMQNEVVLAPSGRHTDHTPPHHGHGHATHAPAHASRNALAPLVARERDQAPLPAGKPSLAQQFAQARAALHAVRPAPAATAAAPVATEHRA